MNYSKTGLVVAVGAFGIALIACSDDVAKVTEVSEVAEITEGTGQIVIAKGEKLPDCTKDREGEEVFVTDSASVYHCAEGKWSTLKGPAKENDEKTVALYRAMGSTETDNIYRLEQLYGSRLGVFYDDRDFREYKTVTIEIPSGNYNRTWMAENLDYNTNTKTDTNSWCAGAGKGDCAKYGRLYTWDAAMKACPVGWHLSSLAEWRELFSAIIRTGEIGSLVDVMKVFKSKTGWSRDGGGNGADIWQFNVLPAGERIPDYGSLFGGHHNVLVGKQAFFWTSTPYTDYGDRFFVFFVNFHEGWGAPVIASEKRWDHSISVRCVKDY